MAVTGQVFLYCTEQPAVPVHADREEDPSPHLYLVAGVITVVYTGGIASQIFRNEQELTRGQ